MIELSERSLAIWYLELPPGDRIPPGAEGANFLMHAEQCDGHILMKYRFRYYYGDQSKHFEESEDLFRWYEGTLTGPWAVVCEKLRSVARALEQEAGTELFEIINDNGFKDFAERLRHAPWAHTEERPIH